MKTFFLPSAGPVGTFLDLLRSYEKEKRESVSKPRKAPRQALGFGKNHPRPDAGPSSRHGVIRDLLFRADLPAIEPILSVP